MEIYFTLAIIHFVICSCTNLRNGLFNALFTGAVMAVFFPVVYLVFFIGLFIYHKHNEE